MLDLGLLRLARGPRVKVIVAIFVPLFVVVTLGQAPDFELTVKAISGQVSRLGPQDWAKLPHEQARAVGHDERATNTKALSYATFRLRQVRQLQMLCAARK
jgi:hypothetical protein